MYNKPIYVLTYQGKHRKTYDTLCRLRALGYQEVSVYAVPMRYTKKYRPLIEHRPENSDIDTEVLCANIGYRFASVADYEEITAPDKAAFLVCGAGILPDTFIKRYQVINAHPGYIPDVRGLDALKWAIYENKKIGVSTHLIGAYIDAGEMLDRQLVPLFQNDTLYTIAMRQYQMEIKMLVEAVERLDAPMQLITVADNDIHKRMPYEIELQLEVCLKERLRSLPAGVEIVVSP